MSNVSDFEINDVYLFATKEVFVYDYTGCCLGNRADFF